MTSGIWTDYKVTSVEDQIKFAVPLNRDTENLFYNQRIIIDNNVLTEPRTWKLTKINRITQKGIVVVTLAQDLFNEHTDYIEMDENGEVIAMWADYYSSEITPTEPEDTLPSPTEYSVISYSGIKPEIKVGGNYKTFTVKFFNNQNEEIPFQYGQWKFEYYNTKDNVRNDATSLLDTSTNDLEQNQIDIKFIGADSHIGDILVVNYESYTGVKSEIEMEIVGL